jgi:thiol:disulfide interchange protein DsbD
LKVEKFMKVKWWVRVGWLALVLAVAGVVHAQGIAGLLPIDQAYKLTASVATPGVIKLHGAIAPHYYLYRGQMKFIGGEGVTLSAAQLPNGHKYHDQYLGDVETYHDSIDATIPYTLAPGTKRIKFSVRYQGCHEVTPLICYPPHTRDFDLPLPGSAAAVGTKRGSSGGSLPPRNALDVLDPAPQSQVDAASATSTITAGLGASSANAEISPSIGLGLALLLAFVGGLILNLMPCVLPVLAIKAVGLLESGESRQQARSHALAYAAGVICSFLVIGIAILALRSAGHAIGWGTQLQQPLVVAVLACVMFAVGLSMSGLVQFGSRLGNVGAGLIKGGGAVSNFFTGVLAVFVATPCTAPFMGVALAYALVAQPANELLVMLVLGIGLALPLALIGMVPAFARLLPKPGRWMETLKQILAFPMYLSAVWLVWVLAHQRGADAVALVLIAMVLLGAAAWWHGRGYPGCTFGHVFTVALALVAIVSLYGVTRIAPSTETVPATSDSVVFSPAKLQALRAAGTPVFVDMTADWCITCKANEHTVLDTAAFRDLLKRTGTVYMVGDWTDVNPMIGAFLQKYHSPGVPLYVIFPKGDRDGKVLPTVLTISLLQQALEAAS